MIRTDDEFEDQYYKKDGVVIIRPCYNNDYNLHLTLKEAEWYLNGLIDAHEKLTGLANLNLVFCE